MAKLKSSGMNVRVKARLQPQQLKNPHSSHPLWPAFIEWVKDERSGLNPELVHDDVFLKHGIALWRTFVHAYLLPPVPGTDSATMSRIPR